MILQYTANKKCKSERSRGNMSKQYLKIIGGNPLVGRVEVHGAKNAVLPILAAGLLTKEDLVVENCPYITDVEAMVKLLCNLGASVTREGRRIIVRGQATHARVNDTLCKDMRSSMFMLGALLATLGEVETPLPGGCKIGLRPLDIHLDGLRKMGVEVELQKDGIRCSAKRLVGAKILMKYPSVGATENLLMCATLAKGRTTLVNCAREPEIVSLAECLRGMGAKISGEGTSVMHIEGVKELGGTRYTPVGDRIVAGTILCGVALCGGDVEIDGANAKHLGAVIGVLQSKDCKIYGDDSYMRVQSSGRMHALRAQTAPYPLFPTDMQPQLLCASCFSDGVSVVSETVFENRFAHAKEMQKLGAKINVCHNVAVVSGCDRAEFPYMIKGGKLVASDLRGGAALCLAALKIQGESMVYGLEYIDRGYERIEDTICALGGYAIRKNEG